MKTSAGEHTSCEFTAVIYDEALTKQYRRGPVVDPTVDNLPKATFNAVSPKTGKSYEITYYPGSDQLTLICYSDTDKDLSTNYAIPNHDVPDWGDRLDIIY
ncbi:MAG: hypothetical protein MR654_04340 [Corynebacterium glucuronolyticum]|nr:hypothetical protein [Corynebacterium glucuronolyticum]